MKSIIVFKVLSMEDLQNGLRGAHAQSPHYVCKASKHEPGAAPTPPRQMAAMTAWGWQKRNWTAPLKRMGVQVKREWRSFGKKAGSPVASFSGASKIVEEKERKYGLHGQGNMERFHVTAKGHRKGQLRKGGACAFYSLLFSICIALCIFVPTRLRTNHEVPSIRALIHLSVRLSIHFILYLYRIILYYWGLSLECTTRRLETITICYCFQKEN